MLQIGLGQYFGSILGFVLSYMKPTMNPCGYFVVKQAKNLRKSTCMGNWWGELLGSVFSWLMELFQEFEGGKHQVGSEAEVGISIKGEKDQSVRDLWHFFKASMHIF